MGGTPFTLRCPKCKAGASYGSHRLYAAARDLEKTGRERYRTTPQRRGKSAHQVEVVHKPCGHVFWTTHPQWTTNRPIRLAPGA